MPTFKKLSPVLVVHEAGASVDFWERLGFAKTAEVPHDDTLGFVILEKDGIEVMYQTVVSIAEDNAASADAVHAGGSCLYIEVDDLESVIRATDGAPVVVPRRTTFYGMDEIGVKEPGGHLIMFALKA